MMSRAELQDVVRGALVRVNELSKGRHDPIRDSSNIIANRIGIHWSGKAEFARGVERILRDHHESGNTDSDAVTGAVADWVLEQVS